jgi:hypothetical protein
VSTDSFPRGPGLFEIVHDTGERVVTNVRRLAGKETPPGRILVNTATILLGLLAAGLFGVSLAAQYRYIFHAKHQVAASIVEALALDAGMVIFSLLALGLARGGKPARVERALILACAAGSAAMNYAAADVVSPRSVAAYVMPPVFLAIVTDRVIAVVRRHMLGDDERSAWAVLGRAVVRALAITAKVALYGLRLVLAHGSTLAGLRRCVLLATPLPAPSATPGDLDGEAVPPAGACMARTGPRTGDLCGRGRPCTRHEPHVPLPGETKKAHLARLYADHADQGNRAAAGRVAAQLAPHVQLGAGTARAYIYQFLEKAGGAAS